MHLSSIRVRYAETDQAGVAYHASYLPWFEVGRTEFLRDAGFPYAVFEKETALYLTVVEAKLRYHRPAHYDEVIEVGTWIGELSRVRMRLEHRLSRQGTDEVVCTGHIVLACIDAEGRPRAMPPELAGVLRRLSGEGDGKIAPEGGV